MEADNKMNAFTNFGGGTAGPLTPPTLPFRFGRDQEFLVQDHDRAPPRGNTRDFRNFPRSGSSTGNVYRREAASTFFDGNAPRNMGGVPKLGTSRPPGIPTSKSRSPDPQRYHDLDQGVTSVPGYVPRNHVLDGNVPRNKSPGIHISSRVSRSPPLSMEEQPPRGAPRTTSRPLIPRSMSPPLSIDEQQRESDARARRLQRFQAEPAVPMPVVEPMVKPEPRKRPILADATDGQEDENWRSAEPILGLCPDMCPDQERAERERKGDLDRFERLDGDRNQTSRDLAVKKYTRTPERDPNLIRPLSVLRETMDYLLGLLDRPYGGEDMLVLYNFLWDRMRAVRMDLRMQHIFNHEAIVMHEQMIRFHILAMHEFCEYSKGEGFTEGFDAHLNIEQMNKTSVDLFQMYDEHRQQGTPALNEPEFRGYYALLKLDKHPGYMVEPAELSADLAKMSPDMRNSADVLFARRVARSCRLPNYIAFFRMARTATYLQACLMHAHFSKLRTQALASLHSGLKSSQGIPLVQITASLGMESDEIEDLLQYHGFSIKQFEEPYMVKEGAFLNVDRDYRTYKSRLVEAKRWSTVRNDVVARKEPSYSFSDRIQAEARTPGSPEIVDEEIPDYEEEMEVSTDDYYIQRPRAEPVQSPRADFLKRPRTEFMPSPRGEFVHSPRGEFVPSPRAEFVKPVSPIREPSSPVWQPATPDRGLKRQREGDDEADHSSKRHDRGQAEAAAAAAAAAAEAGRQQELREQREKEKRRLEEQRKRLQEELRREGEAFNGRAKLWLRRWKRRTDAKIEAARLRRERAEAALASISVGLQFHETRKAQEPVQSINLNNVTAQRKGTLNTMWGYVDVPSLITPVFKRKNPQISSICWKLALYSGVQQQPDSDQISSTVAGHWLRSKVFHEDPKLGKYSPTETFVSKDVVDGTYCCYVAKDVGFNGNRLKSPASLYGTSGILFLVREDSPLQESCSRLHALVEGLPLGLGLPLVVLSYQGATTVQAYREPLERTLELQRLDRGKVSDWLVVRLTGDSRGFFSTEALVSGLQWLAAAAPPQPVLRPVNLRDLVWEHLRRSLKLCDRQHEFSFQMCISVFNRALDDAADEVSSAAQRSRSNWPPPEFGRAPDDWVGCSLPNSGWNDPSNMQPIFDALYCSRLPYISTDNWQFVFSRGILGDGLVEEVRAHYELIKATFGEYLKIIDDNISQAQSLVEDAAVLEWSEEQCCIVVDWVRVFQGIYQNRLMLLNSEPPAIVYVSSSKPPDEDDDYQRKIRFASKLRCSLRESEPDDDLGLPEKNARTQERIQTEAEEMDGIRRELEYLRSAEHVRSLESLQASVGLKPGLSTSEDVDLLDVLVREVHHKVDSSLSETSEGRIVPLETSSRSSGNVGLARYRDDGSAGGAEKKFAELLNCCERLQLSNGDKLADYFGVTMAA